MVMFTAISVILKPVFMFYNHSAFKDCNFTDYLAVIWHGLPMDVSVAGYFTIIPALLALISIWLHPALIRILHRTYLALASFLISIVYCTDAVLYGFWQFRIDSTPFFYFLSSPKDALASVPIWWVLLGVVVVLLLTAMLFFMLCKTIGTFPESKGIAKDRLIASGVMVVVLALLFVPIRGSLGTSTMNLGRVYYSENQKLNHAAINPCFSLLSSLMNDEDTKDQYRFMAADEANKLFSQITDKTKQGGTDAVFKLLNTNRPNIVMVVLESFSAHIMKSMGGTANVAVNMDKWANEGVLFTNFYANSFRTDRGLAAILAGYPAQPTMSIMKYPNKTGNMPMFPQKLKKAGYQLKYYYGGDADFTNMRSFVTTAGFEDLISDADFPIKLRLSKWGVPDQYVFDRALADIKSQAPNATHLSVIQTSSSHEPYDVPFKKLNNKILNAFAYTDNCLGKFVAALKKLPSWKNTLVVLVPDHQGCYPEDMDNYSPQRYHIPLLLLGGALKAKGPIATLGSQADIAATLLSQLGFSYSEFTFSKDMLNPNVPHFAFSTVPNAFMMKTTDNTVFYNCETNKTILDNGKTPGKNLPYGKAYLQKLYDDISNR
ncbi:LTA synthase family protein [Prevotella sp. oral taxon 317]|jgi:membrane attached sulfatase|uniref:LTA synthase family protein n=1 Tax=Prevotella sp. oral taxon 317 TaxID=652721 RepID=UPI0018DC27B0|nr:alkaline phosphatase family protein [Prevotella sp. oral taxon 317]